MKLNDILTRHGVIKKGGAAEEIHDKSGSPGPKVLIAGDFTAGYFGEVSDSEFFTSSEVSLGVGLSLGDLTFENEVSWFKFALDNKVVFFPRQPLRNKLAREALPRNVVSGLSSISKDSLEYSVRLIKGTTGFQDAEIGWSTPKHTNAEILKSEWNRIILPLSIRNKDNSWSFPQYIPEDLEDWGIHHNLEHFTGGGSGSYTLINELLRKEYSGSAYDNYIRGGSSVENYGIYRGASRALGWRPLLEVLDYNLEEIE